MTAHATLVAHLLCLALLSGFASAGGAAIPNVRLTTDAASSVRPRVALDPQANVVVVWQDGRFGNDEILWQKFDQQGTPLSGVVRVTNTAAASRLPDVSCDPSGVSHVVWQEGENVNGVGTVYFCRLDAAGTKILNDVQISVTNCGYPRVEALTDGSTDIAFFRSSGVIDFYVLYRRYAANATLVCSKQLGSSFTATVLAPTIATSATGTANVSWLDIPTSSYQVRFGTVASCGTPSIWTLFSATSTTRTTTAIGGTNVFLLFDTGGNIRNLISTNNACQISQGSGQASTPSVGADAHDAYVVWRDNRDGPNGEIYFARFWDCTNRSGDVRLTTDPAASLEPDIAVDPSGSGNWIAVWRDARDGNNEIYLTSRLLIDGPTPATPTGLTATRVASACPPQVQLQWTDASSNETRFDVEMETDGSGTWVPVATLGMNASNWTSGALAYGHSYEFHVRACNGAYCSAWAGPQSVTIDYVSRLFDGTMSATVIGAPTDPASLQPLRRVLVGIYRPGQPFNQPIASTYADDTGHYSLSALVQCDDQIGVVLDDSRVTVEDLAGGKGTSCHLVGEASWLEPLPAAGQSDMAWPLASDISGNAPNAWYWIQRTLDEYWRDVMGVAYTSVPLLGVSVNRSDANAGYVACGSFLPGGGPPGYVAFPSKYPRYRSAVEHELAHHMVRNQAQRSLYRGRDGDCSQNPQVCCIDEGLADYFAAAQDENPAIYPYTISDVFFPWSLRNLSKLTKLHACNGEFFFSNDPHHEGSALSGALWDWRTRLKSDHQVSSGDVDRAVFAAVRGFRDADPYDPTITGFRAAVAATPLGTQYAADLSWAFDRHNIKLPMDQDLTCPIRPLLDLTQATKPDGRHSSLSWTSVPGAHHYQLALRQFTPGLELGKVIADSLVGTSYEYVESDTTVLDAFLVSAIDDSGEVITASDETPLVTGIGPGRVSDGHEPLRAYPNPARAAITIEFGSRRSAPGPVMVCDVAGRVVRRLEAPVAMGDGRWRANWDGRGAQGRHVPPGIYLVRTLDADARTVRVVWMP